jgi:dienelactone hydrolase
MPSFTRVRSLAAAAFAAAALASEEPGLSSLRGARPLTSSATQLGSLGEPLKSMTEKSETQNDEEQKSTWVQVDPASYIHEEELANYGFHGQPAFIAQPNCAPPQGSGGFPGLIIASERDESLPLYKFMSRMFAGRGIVAMSFATYAGSDPPKFRAQSVAKAIHWLKKNSAKYQVNPLDLNLLGFSASAVVVLDHALGASASDVKTHIVLSGYGKKRDVNIVNPNAGPLLLIQAENDGSMGFYPKVPEFIQNQSAVAPGQVHGLFYERGGHHVMQHTDFLAETEKFIKHTEDYVAPRDKNSIFHVGDIGEFTTISDEKACLTNSDNVEPWKKIASWHGSNGLAVCKGECTQLSGCVAIDFLKDVNNNTENCFLYKKACKNPTYLGGESYSLRTPGGELAAYCK